MTTNTERAQLIRKLHAAGASRFVIKGVPVHDLLHDMATCTFDVDSLTACTPEQLRYLLSSVLAHPIRKTRTTRKRSGRRRDAGVVKMASHRQKDLINTLASELAWPVGMLNRWLKRFFDADTVDQITTSQDKTRTERSTG